MAGALQLIARLQAAPVPPVPPCKNSGEPLEAAPLLEVPPVPPAPPVPSRTEQHPIDTTSPATPQRRSAWAVMRAGRPCCQLVGEPMTRAEALEAARWRWPDADTLES